MPGDRTDDHRRGKVDTMSFEIPYSNLLGLPYVMAKSAQRTLILVDMRYECIRKTLIVEVSSQGEGSVCLVKATLHTYVSL
jgi:hypothetical protein